MPMIDCPYCGRSGVEPCDIGIPGHPCLTCNGTGRVPDDFFPDDSSELREEPEEVSDGDS